jgi:hypothetical protein
MEKREKSFRKPSTESEKLFNYYCLLQFRNVMQDKCFGVDVAQLAGMSLRAKLSREPFSEHA